MPSETTILLVEDDHLLRQAFRILLEEAGYRCVEAGSAAEALARVGEVVPALVLLDLGLPDRPGLEVVEEMRRQRRTSEVPVVALTGRSGEEERQMCLASGCTDYFSKPLEPRELLRRLPDLLQGRVGNRV